MPPLLRRVQQTIEDYQMIERGHTVLVAVSGGADSTVLLHALWQLREALALQLYAAHLNHQMRADADDDARFVETAADQLGIRCICETRDVATYQRQHRLSPEDAARRVRYAFLRATARQLRADRIAIGHTSNDQAETVLLQLLRGSGLRGLCGMPAVRGRIVRPLLRVSRADILEYVRRHQLKFREDPSNAQERYRRNRIRHDLLPALQQHYNPRLVQGLSRMAQLLADDEAALQMAAHQCFLEACLADTPAAVHLRIEALMSFSLALQRRVLRQALSRVMGNLQGVTSTHIAAIIDLLRSDTGHKWLRLPHGVVVERRYTALLIQRRAASAVVAVDLPLPVPGVCRVEALGVTIVSAYLPRHAATGPYPSGNVTWLDADSVGQEVRVRTRRPGDRLQPLGSRDSKKLKAFLIDVKMPRMERDSLPLVVARRGIAWVAGMRPAEWAKVTPATREILRLQLLHDTAQAAENTVLTQP